MKQEVVKRAGGDTVGEAQSGGGGAGEGWERAGGSALGGPLMTLRRANVGGWRRPERRSNRRRGRS
jgi:hypothetical protein